jgi:hypothetical protein
MKETVFRAFVVGFQHWRLRRGCPPTVTHSSPAGSNYRLGERPEKFDPGGPTPGSGNPGEIWDMISPNQSLRST